MSLHAYHCSNLLFVHWKHVGVTPANFRIFLNRTKFSGLVAGNRLNNGDASEKHIILIAQSEKIPQDCEIEIISDDGQILASWPRQEVPLISDQIVSNLATGSEQRFWRFLFDYLPKALPTVARSTLFELYSRLIEQEAAVAVLAGIVRHVRISVSTGTRHGVFEFRILSESGFRQFTRLHVLVEANCLHILLPMDDDLDWHRAIAVIIFDDKSYLSFKINSVFEIADAGSLVNVIESNYSGNRLAVERFLLRFLSSNVEKSSHYRRAGDLVWGQCDIPNNACEFPDKTFLFRIDDVKTVSGLGTLVVGVYKDQSNIVVALITHEGRRIPVEELGFFEKANGINRNAMAFAFILPEEPLWNTTSFALELKGGKRFDLGGIKNNLGYAGQRDWLITYANWHSIKHGGEAFPKAVAICHEKAIASARRPVDEHKFNSTSIQPCRYKIIIPLDYFDCDLLKTQFAVLAGDEDILRSEILLILPRSDWSDTAVSEIKNLARIYQLPIRLMILAGSIARHIAYNTGLSVPGSSGNVVIFLSPEVIPQQDGWLSLLITALLADETVFVATPRLLFDDPTMVETENERMSDINHFDRNIPRPESYSEYPDAAKVRGVTANSVTCAAINIAHLQSVGVFDERFLLAESAYREWCLRVIQTGYRIMSVPDIKMWFLKTPKYACHAGERWMDYDEFFYRTSCES